MVIYRFRLYKLMSHVYGVWAVGEQNFTIECPHVQRRIQDFKLGGGWTLKNCTERREARKFLGYFVWKITILCQKIIFFPIAEGGAKFLGYFVWKITILRQKIIFFPILGGTRAGCTLPPGSAPCMWELSRRSTKLYKWMIPRWPPSLS